MSVETETTNLGAPATETAATETSLVNGQTSTEGVTTTEGGEGEAKVVEEVTKTPEEIAAETAKAEADALAAAPVTVEDIVLPEGMTAEPELMKEFVDLVNNSELSAKDRATALIDLQVKAMTAASEASSAAWNDMQKQWQDEVKAEFGDRLVTSLASINSLVTEHGDEKLIEAFAVTGAGNNVHVIKFLSTISNLLTEGKFASGSPGGQEKTAAQRLYPSMPN